MILHYARSTDPAGEIWRGFCLPAPRRKCRWDELPFRGAARNFSSFPNLETLRGKIVDGLVLECENRSVDVDCACSQAVPWHCGLSPEAIPVEELTPGCVREVRIPASASATGFLLRAVAQSTGTGITE